MNIAILAEDTYGPKFFEELIKRLKNELNLAKDIKIEYNCISGICSPKMTRIINTAINDFDRVIVVADGDGNPEEKENDIKKKHFPDDRNKKEKINALVFQYEIEEWICYSLGIKFSDKPSVALREYKRNKEGFKSGNEKKYLSTYVKDLNFVKLEKYETFKKFIKLLNS